jgi:hypothetical protein
VGFIDFVSIDSNFVIDSSNDCRRYWWEMRGEREGIRGNGRGCEWRGWPGQIPASSAARPGEQRRGQPGQSLLNSC